MSLLPPPAPMAEDPVLVALCDAACTITGAASGWVIAVVGDRLQVVAACGPAAGSVRGLTVDVDGSAGFVAASGQPMAITPRPGDPNVAGGVLGAAGVVPTSLLALPCHHDDDVLGVLELVDKAGGERFTFEDVELATVLASVAGPALAQRSAQPAAPAPDVLAAQLRVLADADPVRYARTAWVVQRLVAGP